MAKSKWEDVKEKLVLVEGWARDGLIEEQIAKNLGISVTTLKDYKNRYPSFLSAIKKGKEVADYEVEAALYNKALSGDTTAMIFWLKNRKPHNWRDKQEMDVNQNITEIKIIPPIFEGDE